MPPDRLHDVFGRGIESSSDYWYNVVEKLDEGEGGTSSIYHVIRSTHESDRETIAKGGGVSYVLKILTVQRDELEQRLLAEREFLSDTEHPSILKCHDVGYWYEYPFFIAEYLPNTLSEMMGNKISNALKVNYSTQLVSAIVELEQNNPSIVHRDIKPRNIFITGNKCVLGDFGVIKFLDGDDQDDRQIWQDSSQQAMPYYYPTPGLVSYANNEGDISTKENVYQLGLVLSHLFTGQNPANPADRIDDRLEFNERDELGDVPGTYGWRIEEVLESMIEEDESNRPQATEILDDWEGIMMEVAEASHDLNGYVFK